MCILGTEAEDEYWVVVCEVSPQERELRSSSNLTRNHDPKWTLRLWPELPKQSIVNETGRTLTVPLV